MEGNFSALEKKLKGLRLCYLVIGSIFFTLGLVVVALGIYSYYYYPYETPSMFLWMVALISPIFLLSGILLIVTYYGIRHALRFARFTGVTGCLLFIFMLMLFFSPSTYFFDPLSFFIQLIFLITPVLLLLYTFLMWKEIQGDKKLEIKPKTKKIMVTAVIGIFILGILIFVIPEVNKKLVLGSLEYTNYDLGFGFNPPEGWNTSKKYGGISCSPPLGVNASNTISLTISASIGSTTGKPITVERMKEIFLNVLSGKSNYTANFSLISQNDRTVNGMDAYEFVYTYENIINNVTGPKMKEKKVVFAKNTVGWEITYQSLESLYSTYETEVEQSINSITVI